MSARRVRGAGAPGRDEATGARDEAATTDFVEHLAAVFAVAGFPRMPARAFALLLAEESGRLTAQAIAERLRASRGGVSGAMRYLETVRLVRRVREPGSRADVFVVQDDVWREATVAQDAVYGPILAVLAEGVTAVGGAQTAAGQRLELSREFLEFVRDETNGVLRRWDEHVRRTRGAGQET